MQLNANWLEYQYQFQAKELAALNKITFNVGERKGIVWIADFTVTKVAK